ncbi:hypothetical protein [Bacillus sp. FDAARGOS_1420]|uniref:hypothetical protein n=1 Tax=Bacillus sp. FDAARGOS_1420 TaxID=2856338 RepID=UPI001C5B59C5|nr:hypothetical protein [Bacillus sp. FDAARGOS_1420]MBW3496789.1 hypothetical protein [Bacillus sp. FDAARGOS_1420]
MDIRIRGMVYTSINIRPTVHKMLKEEEIDEKGEATMIAVVFIIICVFTPLGPVLLAFRVIKLCSKWVVSASPMYVALTRNKYCEKHQGKGQDCARHYDKYI